MAHAGLEAKLNDISMLLVMLDENDSAAVDVVVSELANLLSIASADPSHSRLAHSTRQVIDKRGALGNADYSKLLNVFLSKAQIYARDPNAALLPFETPGEDASSVLAVQDISDRLEEEFLVEYIEKHTSMMDDFEAAVLDYKYQVTQLSADALQPIEQDFYSFVKGYIHTLKGDSGSIGLIGIERVCHSLEDVFLERPPHTILDQLLLIREWVTGCLRALSAGEPLPENSAVFWSRFTTSFGSTSEPQATEANVIHLTPAMVVEETPVVTAAEPATPAVPSAPAPANDEPYINLELLAELMNDPSPTLNDNKHDDSGDGTYTISGDNDLFVEFVVEAEDHLGAVESTVLDSGGSYGKDQIDLIFRGIHSIKGASSYFSLKEVSESSHLTENLLDEVRSGMREFDQGLTDLILSYIDLQKKLLEQAREAMKSGSKLMYQQITRDYIAELKSYQIGEGAVATGAPAPAAPAPRTAATAAPTAGAAAADEGDGKAKSDKLDVKSFVKVDTQRLDQLIDAIGEMCIYSSMLIQNTRTLFGGNEKLIKTTHQVEKFSRDLQNIGMSMRLIPIRGLFQKMSRLVWDTAKKIGKEVKFEMEGEDTELDRTIIEKLADPLMHMVRNAIDHGVEMPDDRTENGKPRAGSVSLSAYHAGGSIHIRLQDDGRGLDPEKLMKKAVEKGIIAEGQKLTREEAFNLIFAPGFSTAAAVTDISGRGVGMDVVRRNIESMRGRVHIESELGKGSTFTIELPLTLAIIDGIEVKVGGEAFIIPTLSIIEFMRPAPENITRTLDRGETFHFRGKYLPIYRLGELFNLGGYTSDPMEAIFVVVENSGEQAAIMVDEIVGTYSTVIKTLGDMFANVRGVAGCAIVSTGDISLILDVRSLLSLAKQNYTFDFRNTVSQMTASSGEPALLQ